MKGLPTFLLLAWGVSYLAGGESPLMNRGEDPVVFRAKALPALLGTPIDRVTLFRVGSKGKLQKIPFQIDEFARKNGVASPLLISQDQSDAGAAARGRLLDPEDELVFLARDAGRQLFHPQAGVRLAIEIQVTDPAGGGFGFVYLSNAAGNQDPDPGPVPAYVRYDPVEDRVSSAFYQLDYSDTHVGIPFEATVFNPHNPQEHHQILDGFQIGARLIIKPGIPLEFTEKNLRARLVGYKAGPVRVIRRVQGEVKIGPLRLKAKGAADFMYYPSFITFPAQCYNPLGPGWLKKGSASYSYLKLNPEAVMGAKIKTSATTTALAIDGHISEAESEAVGKVTNWWALIGKDWGILSHLDWSATLTQSKMHAYFRYRDDGKASPPEVGYYFDLLQFPRGRHTFTVSQYVGSCVTEPAIAVLVARIRHPLQVSARHFGKAAARGGPE